jgi:hypothetical protein
MSQRENKADDRPLLLISCPEHVLQIFTIPPTRLPEDQHVKERFAPPEEVLSVPTLKYTSSIRKSKNKAGTEKVVSARFIGGVSTDGPLVLLLVAGLGKGMSSYSLTMLSLRTGEVVKRVVIGNGQEADLSVSNRAVVVVSLALSVRCELTSRQCHTLPPHCFSSTLPPSNHSARHCTTSHQSAPHFPLSPSPVAWSHIQPPIHPVTQGKMGSGHSSLPPRHPRDLPRLANQLHPRTS